MQAKIIIFFSGKKLLNLAGELAQWLREQKAWAGVTAPTSSGSQLLISPIQKV